MRNHTIRPQLDQVFPPPYLNQLQKVTFQKNDYICTQGQAITELTYILSGKVKIVRSLFNGKEHILETLNQPQILGDVELMTNQPAGSSVIALEEVQAVQLPLNNKEELLKDPEKYKNDVMVVTSDEFACVRLDTSQVFCMSPLLKDRKRVELILNILNRMNYDISRNGIGTIALQAKDTLEEQIEESVEQGSAFSSGELLDMGRTAKAERTQKIVEDMNAFAEKLSETEFNDAIVYSGNFQNLEQLERDTKATDFLDYLSQYVPAIICQMFGVPARLFDLNKTVSNIGTYSIIDNAMKNTIIPMRDHFLGQIVHLLQHTTGLKEHIKFDSYEFTNSYNYNNDLYILDVYERLKNVDQRMADAYLAKNLIV